MPGLWRQAPTPNSWPLKPPAPCRSEETPESQSLFAPARAPDACAVAPPTKQSKRIADAIVRDERGLPQSPVRRAPRPNRGLSVYDPTNYRCRRRALQPCRRQRLRPNGSNARARAANYGGDYANFNGKVAATSRALLRALLRALQISPGNATRETQL